MASAQRTNVIALSKEEMRTSESNNLELSVRIPLSFHAITSDEGHHRHYRNEHEFWN